MIVSTEDSETSFSTEIPSLEQACQMMASDKFSSEIGFMFAPGLSFTIQQANGFPKRASASYVAITQPSSKLLEQDAFNSCFDTQNNPFSNSSPVFQPAK